MADTIVQEEAARLASKASASNAVAKQSQSQVAQAQKKVPTIQLMMDENTEQGKKFMKMIQKVLPKGIEAARFLVISNYQIRKNPKLLACTTASLYNCMMASARLGVIPDGRNAYLIPYGNECTLQFDYKGLANIVLASGAVKKVYADVVCENDIFENNMGEVTRHVINIAGRGDIIGAYAMAVLPSGEKVFQIMELEEINKVRAKSRNPNGVWKEWFGEMAKKTAFKRLTKWLKLTPDVVEAIEADDAGTTIGDADSPERGLNMGLAKTEADAQNEAIEAEFAVEDGQN